MFFPANTNAGLILYSMTWERFHKKVEIVKLKWPVGELAILGEGISFLMGCSKNYIMYWGGYVYYNSTRFKKSVHKL